MCYYPFHHSVLCDCVLFQLRYGYDEDTLADISEVVFSLFSKCLLIRMENQPNRDQCDICDSITDLSRHAITCDEGHPEVCVLCRSFFNIIERHMIACDGCDMHLCVKLKLKLLKYNLLIDEGDLVHLWPKIQGYISRLFPDVTVPFRPVVLPKSLPTLPAENTEGWCW